MKRPSPAMVVATLALGVALGGTSYAAMRIPANSVGTAQLRNGAVTAAKIRAHSLTASDFEAGQLPAGERGATGATGPAGAAGAAGTAGTAGASYVSSMSFAGGAAIPTDGTTTTVLSSASFTAAPNTLYEVIRDGKEWSGGPTGPDCAPAATSGATTHVTVNGAQVGGGTTTFIGPYTVATPVTFTSDVKFCSSGTAAAMAAHRVYVLAFQQ
jgi:hypothetical protein